MTDAHRIRRQRARLRRERSEAIRENQDPNHDPNHDRPQDRLDAIGGAAMSPKRDSRMPPERQNTGRQNTGRQNTGRQDTGRQDIGRQDIGPAIGPGVGWDHNASVQSQALAKRARQEAPLTAQLLALFAEPGVYAITPRLAADTLERPVPDIENALEALVSAGELVRAPGHAPRYHVSEARKAQLEHMFTEAAHEVGETQALARYRPQGLAVFDENEEPRLPVTAGLLSLFLPGTGQLLNGDVGRASLVFAVWSLALLIHLPAIWTFVALYAGAEAFFTAKVRGIERRIELDGSPDPELSEG